MNLPQIFVEQMKEILGPELPEYLESYEKPKFTGLRVNTSKISVEEFERISPFKTLRRVPWTPNGYYYTEEDAPTKHPYYYAGLYYIQEASAMLPAKLVNAQPGEKILDMCAAPGGKTILAAEYTKETGHVLSRDVSEYKTALILENLERMHRTNVKVEVHDATVYDAEREASADVVLMDVPCSGLGVMGKKRDIKYHVTPEGLKSIHELQRQIVEAGWRYVKPGGVLLYSTCTINREENQNMAAWITEKFPFVLEEERQLLPGTDETDGFYFARLRRRT